MFYLSFKAKHGDTPLLISLLLLAGDVAANPGPDSTYEGNPTTQTWYVKSIKCLLMNARSIVNKTHEFNTFTINYDVIGVTETWLKPDILDSEILPSNDFSIYRRDRVNKTGGGVMLAVRSSIPSLRRSDLETNAEIVACELRPKSRQKLLVAVFYRPPDSNTQYLKQLKRFLNGVRRQSFESIIVIGDFNLPHMDWSSISPSTYDENHTYFSKIIKDNFLWQLVDFPTRGQNILDLLLTNIPHKTINIAGFDSIIKTDHKLIEFEINLKIPKQSRPIKRKLYNFKNADWNGLKQTLNTIPWDLCFVENDIDESLSNWMDLFLQAVDQHIPTCSSRKSNDHPWIDAELRNLIKKKDRQRRKANRSQKPTDRTKFIELRREVKAALRRKKRDHALELKTHLCDNPKRFWKYVKSITKKSTSPNFLRDGQTFISDPMEKANLLNEYFQSVFVQDDDEHLLHYNTRKSPHSLSEFELTITEVYEALRNIDPDKASGPDSIPGRLLKEVALEISPSLTKLFNQSLNDSCFPQKWKMANLFPLHKQEDPTLANNYRPISLLCTLSKVFERCVFNHFSPFLSAQFYHLQYGFRSGRSTTTQLLVVYQDILESLSKGLEVDIIFLDLAKAFDKVSHVYLIDKLKLFGIEGKLINWLKSYLDGRRQRVVVEGAYSEWLAVTSGVPQGSNLGPLLFLAYINDLPNYTINHSPVALFADDSKLFRTIKNETDHGKLQSDLSELNRWSSDWMMNFNASKCKVLNISKKVIKVERQYQLNSSTLSPVDQISDLGLKVNNTLTWNRHIEEISLKANRKLGLIRRLCKGNKDVEIRKLLYCCIVRPSLEYASEVWSPYTIKNKALLENVQRRATKFILGYPENMNYKERLSRLGFLPLEYRREIADLILLFKFQKGHTDMENLKHFKKVSGHAYRTRNFDPNNYCEKMVRQDYLKHFFFNRVISLWNKLPSFLKTIDSLTLFKTKLQDHYLKKFNSEFT